jgi:3-methyladenine DNA glycosylase AlkD
MQIIGSKALAAELMKPLFDNYSPQKEKLFVADLQTQLLKKKVRFPVLEFVGKQIYETIPPARHLGLLDEIVSLREIGGNVLAGALLQLRLEKNYSRSLEKAVEYIIGGDAWYVCDIIGERVMGHALLHQPEKTISKLKKYTNHPDKWIVRCVGVAIHYAVKKGLNKHYSEQSFRILLSCCTTTDFHTKKGIGWAAKTVAKFHPDIIAKYEVHLNSPDVRPWFKTKIKIGLGRSFKYASRSTR